MSFVYLDNAATTPVSPEVRAAMEPYFHEVYGNPSSVHAAGRKARSAVDKAREQVARALHASTQEILFTSGGTEADNSAILGIAMSYREQGRHLVTTSIEHKAVLSACEFLESLGWEVTYVDPDEEGHISLAKIEEALRPDTVLVSVMMVNNETGSVQPISEIGALLRERGVFLHSDAVQAAGLLALDVKELNVDLLSISGHKLHGPKGIGALYIKNGIRWTPVLHGGNQERTRRGGTENLPGIVGLGAAVERSVADREDKLAHVRTLRDAMLAIFREEMGEGVVLNSPEDALPSILNVSFVGVPTERLLMNLDINAIAASSGSACTSGSLQPSHVLLAMGLSEERVLSSIRLSFSGYNTLEEVTAAARKICEAALRLRKR
jgi:cysteine desulfurase